MTNKKTKNPETVVSEPTAVRRSQRSRKAPQFYAPEEVVSNSGKKEKTKSDSKKSSQSSVDNNQETKPKTKRTPTVKAKTSKTVAKKCGRKSAKKLLFDYRSHKKRIPDYQKRLKYVEIDPAVEGLHQKLGLVAQRLSAIEEENELLV